MSQFRIYVIRCDQCGAEIRSPSPYVPPAQARREGWEVSDAYRWDESKGSHVEVRVRRDVCAACVKANAA